MKSLIRTLSTGRERRAQPRFPVNYGTTVQLSDAPGAALIPARVVGVSDRGFELRVGFIVPSTVIHIHWQNRIVKARIRYCVSADEEFSVGVRVA